ncbi:hypothetical protein JZM37_03225 [Acinetobacter pittii]|uniref:hypothetical protein n=1 Tax=Acinetobacter pittii TaxID=48296 RepID=UPI00197D67DD|nr:hypothetical protein [Acinetobacter pittii]MBN6523270.1 hypothetical protein [Acinetobacter pittii]
MLKNTFLCILLFCSLAACDTLPKDNLVKVFKSLQSTQCENSGIEVSALKQKLIENSINVYSEAIGNDGVIRPQVCGAPDGKTAIFRISYSKLKDAQKLGFKVYD